MDVIANQTSRTSRPAASPNSKATRPSLPQPGRRASGFRNGRRATHRDHLDTTGRANVYVAYILRDIDGTADNAIQPVALQYRVGRSGDYTNLPAGFVADATTGPSLATLVTPVNVALPSAADNQALVQIRIITTNAAGTDEWVGIDDISVTASAIDQAPAVQSTTPTDGATDVALDRTSR